MTTTILECTESSITLSRFGKSGKKLVLQYKIGKSLRCAFNETLPADWVEAASATIKEILDETGAIFPLTILLPGFAVLTKVIKVPQVVPSSQTHVIRTHVSQFLGTSDEELLGFVIRDYNEVEMDVICSFVKKSWINSFCNSIDSIGVKIASIEPPALHYYNAFYANFLLGDKKNLLLVLHYQSIYFIFINKNNVLINRMQLMEVKVHEIVEKMLNFHKTKYPDSSPEELFIAGSNTYYDELIISLAKHIELPIKKFSPLAEEHADIVGSIGAANVIEFCQGLSIDLTPKRTRKAWMFRRSKNAVLFLGLCICISLVILLFSITDRQRYYYDLVQAFDAKIAPLKEKASIIERSEKIIAIYEKDFDALEAYTKSRNSWVHFLNSLQVILAGIPDVQIHSLNIVQAEGKVKNEWKDELMGAEEFQDEFLEPRLMHLSGALLVENSSISVDKAIGEIRHLLAEITKIECIGNAKDLYVDSQSFPLVPFSFSLTLNADAL